MRADAARATRDGSRSNLSEPVFNWPLGAAKQEMADASVDRLGSSQWLHLRRTTGNHQGGELLHRASGMAPAVGSSVSPGMEARFGHDFSNVPAQTEGPALAPPIVHAVLRSSGEPLDTRARVLFESAFARDLDHVRIHTDAEAARSAETVDAAAYTVGHHVVFGPGRYDLASAQGRMLLAHELAHTVQQDGQEPGSDRIEIARADSPLEREGAEVARTGLSARHGPAFRASGAQLLRQPATGGTATPAEEFEIEFGPAVSGRSRQELARRRRIADAAESRYSIIARTYIDSAFQWALAGERIAVAQVDDAVVKENFYRALAGNMLWAATSIFAAWNPVVIPMSFIGAALGSGVAAEESGLPRGEELLLRRWAREADQLERDSGPLRVRAAEVAAAADIPEWDHDALDRTLWQVMFPTIPWETRREAIVELARARVQRALTGFLTQYRAWRWEITQCMALRMPTSEEPTVPSWVSIGAPEECERVYPFNPTLDFGLAISGGSGFRERLREAGRGTR